MLLLVLVSILWIPVIQASQGGQLFIYIQSISSYLQPPVAVVFIMGCFWRRSTEKVGGPAGSRPRREAGLERGPGGSALGVAGGMSSMEEETGRVLPVRQTPAGCVRMD